MLHVVVGLPHLLQAVAPAVRELYPDGVDTALDLVGTPTLPDTLRAVRVHGTVCFGGSLSNQWTVQDFAPNEYCRRAFAWPAISVTPRTGAHAGRAAHQDHDRGLRTATGLVRSISR